MTILYFFAFPVIYNMLVIFEMFVFASIFKLYYHQWMRKHDYGQPFVDVEGPIDQGMEAVTVEMKETKQEEEKEKENEAEKEVEIKAETNGATANQAYDEENVV